MPDETTPAPLPPVPDGHPHAHALYELRERVRSVDNLIAHNVSRGTAREVIASQRVMVVSLRASYRALLALDGRDAGYPHAVREALEAARHAITTLQNLYVTDKPHAYEDAMRDGEDANGARDEQREASWFVDEAPVLATIDAALLALDGRDAGRDAEDAARLDWLEDNCVTVRPVLSQDPEEPKWRLTVEGVGGVIWGDTIRVVLDAARAASAGGAEGAA